MKQHASGIQPLGVAMGQSVLAVNRRARTVRFALFARSDRPEEAVLRGMIEADDDAAVLRQLLAEIADKKLPAPTVVGHRLLYGDDPAVAQSLVDDAVFASLGAKVSRAPMQFGLELALLQTARHVLPDVSHVACFDNAFHASIPEVAFSYALPEEVRSLGVRRLGFHGLAYEHAVDAAGATLLGRSLLFYLDRTASIAAVRGGESLDTTMGFTPLGGLVQGTRPGDLDPGVILFLLRSGYDVRALERIFAERAGITGMTGEGDITSLVPRLARDPRSALAFDIFVRSVQKAAGALVTVLGGLDSVVFMGDAGENATVRDEICHGLAHLGVALDPTRNRAKLAIAGSGAIVSTERSRVSVRVVYADEERMIARHARIALGTRTVVPKVDEFLRRHLG